MDDFDDFVTSSLYHDITHDVIDDYHDDLCHSIPTKNIAEFTVERGDIVLKTRLHINDHVILINTSYY